MRNPPMQARSTPRKQSGRPRPPTPTGGATPPTSAAMRPDTAEIGRFLLKSAHKCAIRPCRRGRRLASNQTAPDPPDRRRHTAHIRRSAAGYGRFLPKSAHECAKMRNPPMQARSTPRKQSDRPRPPRPAAPHRPHPPQCGRIRPKLADFFQKVRMSAQKCAIRPCRRGRGLASNQATPDPPDRRRHTAHIRRNAAGYGRNWPISSKKCA